MHSHLRCPLAYSVLTQMPIIAETIGDHISFGVDDGSADWNTCIVKSFDFVSGLVIPEMDDSIGSSSHEPFLIDGIERNTVDGVEDCITSFLLFITLEGYDCFLN